ncbi:MAG: HipA domain-containing protein [Verrucomicrobiales bacterium]
MTPYPDNICLSTLRVTKGLPYSAGAKVALWNGRKVSPVLNFDLPGFHRIQRDTADRMSISGVQDKISVVVRKGALLPTTEGGEYLLKPVPSTRGLEFQDDVPVNEHLTMQIATQAFGIPVAANGLVFFSDGNPAYLCRRFDRDFDTGQKLPVEDFCQLAKRSELTHGRGFKYEGSYEELGVLVRRFCPAHRIELEKLFRLIVFNYFSGNGDAHWKNFSIVFTSEGDPVLSPAYDLLNTTLHLPHETSTALDLFEDHETTEFLERGFYSGADFLELARRYGMIESRARGIIGSMGSIPGRVKELVGRSFLNDEAKVRYLGILGDRALALSQF